MKKTMSSPNGTKMERLAREVLAKTIPASEAAKALKLTPQRMYQLGISYGIDSAMFGHTRMYCRASFERFRRRPRPTGVHKPS